MVFQNNVLSGAGGSGTTTHTIDQSIRFNDDDSPYMSRTQQAGNQTTWTISCWVKIGNMPGNFTIWSVHTAYQSFAQIRSTTGLQFVVGNGSSSNSYHNLTRLFRDPSAWYHLVMVFDSTNDIASERARIYVNGQRETDYSYTGSWAKDYASNVNSTQTMYIGEQGTGGNHMDGYIAEFVQIDGQALDPSSFGEFNSSGIWIPKDVSGLTFGTNGVYIKGETASDLGNDSSGNGNDFTTSGLASHDQVLDSPTNNFAVANPLHASYYLGSETVAEGNLQFTFGSSVGGLASIGVSSGKWYAEWEIHGSGSPAYYVLGIYGNEPLTTKSYVGKDANSYAYYAYDGTYWVGNSGTSYGNSFGNGDIIGIALDLDNNKLYFSKNGTFQNSGDPTSGSTGTGAISIASASSVPLGQYFIAGSSGSSAPSNHSINYNFGQDGTFAGNVTAGGNSDSNGVGNFKYSVPSGYLALCTKNLGS